MSEPRPRPARPLIGEEGVLRIAELARLRIDPAEVPSLAAHFERMLDFVDKLNEVDVEGVEPDMHPGVFAEGLREDSPWEEGAPGGPVERQRILDNAPESQGPYFTTPRVV
ncbi:MAG: Asp-tRNA(Asn)/Glu-tRNA(Gln) amidotransferase subunit GatC [Planctomycetota bacterium]